MKPKQLQEENQTCWEYAADGVTGRTGSDAVVEFSTEWVVGGMLRPAAEIKMHVTLWA